MKSEDLQVTGIGIPVFQQNTFNIFPNPGKGIFEINAPNIYNLNFKMEVYDNLGRSVMIDEKHTGGKHTIDLTGSAAGVYIVKIGMGNGQVVRKLFLTAVE